MSIIHIEKYLNIINYTAGSGQREPPKLVLEVGGTSTLQAAWDFSFPGMVACKFEVPPTSNTSLGGSRWPDPAVYHYGIS